MPDVTNPTTPLTDLTAHTLADAAVVKANFDKLKATNDEQATAINDLDEANLVVALAAKLGLNSGSQVGRGSSVISAPGTRANTAFGALTNGPDQVLNVVLPAGGLIAVMYQATWQETVSGAASAAIFIGANQLRIASQNTNTGQFAALGGGHAVNTDAVLYSGPAGLLSDVTNVAYPGDVTTGQVVGGFGFSFGYYGGPCYAFAAAGTYAVAVAFKASSGTVTVKDRKLMVWALGP